MQTIEETCPLVEMSPVPVIYADGIASAQVVGSIVRIVFYEVKLLEGITIRRPVLELVRPLHSCLELTLQAMLDVQVARHH